MMMNDGSIIIIQPRSLRYSGWTSLLNEPVWSETSLGVDGSSVMHFLYHVVVKNYDAFFSQQQRIIINSSHLKALRSSIVQSSRQPSHHV